jgi:electron transport complex protein RnfD
MKLVVSFPPHALARHTVRSYHLTWMIAALPAAAAGVCFYGLKALFVLALTTVTAVAAEAAVERLTKRPTTAGNCHSALIGLLLGLTLTPAIPWWAAMVAAVVAVVMAKMVYGGLGFFPFNPVLVGWVVAYLSWPDLIAAYVEPQPGSFWPEFIEGIRPYLLIREDPSEILMYSAWGRFVGGAYAGPIGGSSALAVLIGAAWLFIRGYLPPLLPLGFFLASGITAGIYHLVEPDLYASFWFHWFSGTVMLAALLIGTEPTTSPVTPKGLFFFGVAAGFLTIIFRIHGTHPEAAFSAFLMLNTLTPILDRIRPAVFGKKKMEGMHLE